MTARIAPLAPGERTASAQELLDLTFQTDGRAQNVFATVVRAEGLLRRWLPFLGKLLVGKVPARDRELVVLRTAWNCGAEYEWGQHRVLALEAGLSDGEIDCIAGGPADPWSDWDRTLLRAADELHSTWEVSDATWAELAERYDEQQLIEFPLVVGHYHMASMILRTLRVEPDPHLTGFPQR